MAQNSSETYRAEVRRAELPDGSNLELRVDPVALAALAAARAAGITSPGSTGGLPDLEEVPLRLVCVEMQVESQAGRIEEQRRRLQILEGRIEQLEVEFDHA
jgi:hypothetical protein